jgi:hypothetical protein
MAHPVRAAAYAAFLLLLMVALFVAPSFAPALERMSTFGYSVFCGAAVFVLSTLYLGITARMGIAPLTPAKWVRRLFRVSDDLPPRP